MNVLYVGIFTGQGAMADDYIQLGRYLSKKCNLFYVMGNTDIDYKLTDGRKVLKLSYNKRDKLSYFDLRNYYLLKKYVKENQIDLIFFKTPNLVNIMVSSMFKHMIQVAYCHDFQEHSGIGSLRSLIADQEKRVLACKCKEIYVASESLKRKMLKEKHIWDKAKIKVIPLGIMENLIIPFKEVEEDIDILFFGRIEYYKGLDILIQAAEECPEWKVWICGKGDLKKVFGIKEIPANITNINQYISDEQIGELIQKSKIVILPYRDGTGTQIIQTAMFYGKVVIATDVGSFSDYICHMTDGIIVPPGDKEAIKAWANRVLRDTELRKKLRINAENKSQKEFNNNIIAGKYINAFEALIQNEGCPVG